MFPYTSSQYIPYYVLNKADAPKKVGDKITVKINYVCPNCEHVAGEWEYGASECLCFCHPAERITS